METNILKPHPERMIRKILSGNFLEIQLQSSTYQLVHITVTNLLGEVKASAWEEVFSGENQIAFDISRLLRGSYKLQVNFASLYKKEEIFSLG
jgi:hypothetical protein